MQKAELIETSISPIGDGQAEAEFACSECGEKSGTKIFSNGTKGNEVAGQVIQDATPDDGEICENCGCVFDHSTGSNKERSKIKGLGRM